MGIHICIPTLNRYDLLDKLIDSIRSSTLLPDGLWVIDNGLSYFGCDQLDFTDSFGIQHHYRKFGRNLGVAESWNWFLKQVPEIRIICNDDVAFYPDTIPQLINAYDERAVIYPAGTPGIPNGNSFSCFVLPDAVRAAVGDFDEEIAPGWGYFEDQDYHYRMRLLGYELRGILECKLDHAGSSTFKALTNEQQEYHHHKFRQAESHYRAKWGGEIGQEIYTAPYGVINRLNAQ